MSAGDEVKRAFDDASSHVQSQITTELIGTNTALIQRVSIANGRVRQLEAENADLLREKRALQKRLDELESASHAAGKQIHTVHASLAEWIVSQKAFMQLAIEFGQARGLTHQEVTRMGVDKEMDVLDGKFAPEHNTNALANDFLAARIDSLRQTLAEKKKQREAEALADQTFTRDFDSLVNAGNLVRIGAEPTGWTAAFRYWLRLAEQGMGGAQHNVGWCSENGKGTAADRRRSIAWYTKALEQGVPITPRCMYEHHEWTPGTGFFGGYPGVGEMCVAKGVELGQDWAIAVDRDIKALKYQRSEEERIRKEEKVLFDRVYRYQIGKDRPDSVLEEIKARGSPWLDAACRLYDCDVRLVARNVVNRGSLFRRDEVADFYLIVENPTDSYVSFFLEHSDINRSTSRGFAETVIVAPKSVKEFSIYNASVKSGPLVKIWLREDALERQRLAREKQLT